MPYWTDGRTETEAIVSKLFFLSRVAGCSEAEKYLMFPFLRFFGVNRSSRGARSSLVPGGIVIVCVHWLDGRMDRWKPHR